MTWKMPTAPSQGIARFRRLAGTISSHRTVLLLRVISVTGHHCRRTQSMTSGADGARAVERQVAGHGVPSSGNSPVGRSIRTHARVPHDRRMAAMQEKRAMVGYRLRFSTSFLLNEDEIDVGMRME